MYNIEFRWVECKPKRTRNNVTGEITAKMHGRILQYRTTDDGWWITVPTVIMNYDEFPNGSTKGS